MRGKRTIKQERNKGRQSPDDVQQHAQQRDEPRTPSKKFRLNVLRNEEEQVQGNEVHVDHAHGAAGRVVTPGATATRRSSRMSSSSEAETPNSSLAAASSRAEPSPSSRRALFSASRRSAWQPQNPVPITPLREAAGPVAKRRLMFGRMVTEVHVHENVRKVYKIVRKLTGSLGGNASAGPIYGELTMGSMQKMINLMKEHTGLDADSRFIDVGSGIGKPNLHVAQDPGCISIGIEVEESRWLLGMTCLKGMLDAADGERGINDDLRAEQLIGHRCVFEKGDIRQAKKFDPFSHVYMFSIGYVVVVWHTLDGSQLCVTSPKC